ncbi:hypothetical protein Cgig2_029336 [Carnegiea gigantea]|uniref:Uncharacterized protein n=1 Tax=Carnegiea gigantea TaxID=171969 RepID=A0A9Q1KUK1_9CARY|nr:hypothetical protein Cgig2_029336 [Carnegiea gigantea]
MLLPRTKPQISPLLLRVPTASPLFVGPALPRQLAIRPSSRRRRPPQPLLSVFLQYPHDMTPSSPPQPTHAYPSTRQPLPCLASLRRPLAGPPSPSPPDAAARVSCDSPAPSPCVCIKPLFVGPALLRQLAIRPSSRRRRPPQPLLSVFLQYPHDMTPSSPPQPTHAYPSTRQPLPSLASLRRPLAGPPSPSPPDAAARVSCDSPTPSPCVCIK